MTAKKKIFSDLIWSVLALVMMHGMLQIIVYPSLNKSVGADVFGNILYVLAILGIVAPSIGSAANDTRLIQRKNMTVENGDYFLAMLPQIALGAALFVLLVTGYVSGLVEWILAVLTLVLTMLRNYGGVEYRMSLDYKGYFIYYAAVSAGYLLGTAAYPLTGSWILSFLLGELFGFLLLAVRGNIYRSFRLSHNCKEVYRACWVLAGSYLLYNTVLYLDRILLNHFLDSATVTVYYVASLLGKTAALVVSPLNGVIIGHLTKSGKRIQKKQFVGAFGLAIGLGGMLYVCMLLFCPIFVRLFYPDIVGVVLKFAWLANLSQILCFVASPMLTVMLTFTGAKWQLIIQSVYAVLFVILSILGAYADGLTGFIVFGAAANLLRLVLVFFVGWIQLNRRERSE